MKLFNFLEKSEAPIPVAIADENVTPSELKLKARTIKDEAEAKAKVKLEAEEYETKKFYETQSLSSGLAVEYAMGIIRALADEAASRGEFEVKLGDIQCDIEKPFWWSVWWGGLDERWIFTKVSLFRRNKLIVRKFAYDGLLTDSKVKTVKQISKEMKYVLDSVEASGNDLRNFSDLEFNKQLIDQLKKAGFGVKVDEWTEDQPLLLSISW